MFSFQIGKTTVDLSLLLIFVFVVIPAVVLITAIIKIRQMNSMRRMCLSGNYEKSIVLANRLLTYFTRSYKLFRIKRSESAIESLHVWLSISYLGLSQYEKFLEHINKVEQQPISKYSWLGAYHAIQKDIDRLKYCIEQLELNEDTKNTHELFKGIIMCEEGNTVEGKKILSELLPGLSFELTKKIVLSYVE